MIIQCMLATSGWWLLVLMRSRCLGIFGRITEIASYCSPWLTINTNSQHSTRLNATFINRCHIKQSNKNRDLPRNKISFPLTHTSFWLTGQNLTEKTRFQSWPNIEVYMKCRLHRGEICEQHLFGNGFAPNVLFWSINCDDKRHFSNELWILRKFKIVAVMISVASLVNAQD